MPFRRCFEVGKSEQKNFQLAHTDSQVYHPRTFSLTEFLGKKFRAQEPSIAVFNRFYFFVSIVAGVVDITRAKHEPHARRSEDHNRVRT